MRRFVFYVFIIIRLFFTGFGLPSDFHYTVSNYDFSNEPDWDNVVSVHEVMMHRGDTSYKSVCATDPKDNLGIFENCSHVDVRAEPDPPFKRCRIVINEINTDNPGNVNDKLFIELAEVCFNIPTKRQTSLQGFKLIMIGGLSESIELVADLKDVKLPDVQYPTKRFTVLGTEDTLSVDLKFTDSNVQSIYNNPDHPYRLPSGDESLYAIVLLYSKSLMDLRDIALITIPGTGYYKSQPLTSKLEAKIKKFSQDQVVYGRRAPTSRCDVFERTWFDLTILQPNMKYLLRDWDGTVQQSQDYSLSRCTTVTTPFTPQFFKLAIPTPGTENNCDDAVRFILEEEIAKVTELLPKKIEVLSVPERCRSDIVNIPNYRYLSVDEEKYLQTRDEKLNLAKRVCIRNDEPSTSYATKEMEIDFNNDILDNGGENIPLAPYDVKKFNTDWINIAAPFLPQGTNILLEPTYQSWLRVKSNGGEVRFSCEVCSTMSNEHFKIERNHNKDIMTEESFYSSDKWKNKNEIIEHANDRTHVLAEAYLREVWAQETRTLVQKMIDKDDSVSGNLLLPTIKMIRTVYMEAIESIPFNKHDSIVKLQKQNGVNLGLHFSGRKAAELIMDNIATMFHTILLDFLVTQDKEFSFIMDTTTDTMNIPYLTVHIQTTVGNRPVVFFYRLIDLENGEKAEAMTNSLRQKILDDTNSDRDFEAFVKRRLVTLTTDGASVMIGKHNSMWALLKVKIGRNFPSIICMCHKLENSIKRGIEKSQDKDLLYFKEFNKSVNKIYVFYSSRGSKKWAHFQQTAEALGIRPARIKYYFDIRWASSHFVCLEHIFINYKALIEDTSSIKSDTTFTVAARNEAVRINSDYLINKSWVIVLHEFLDILTVYRQVSLDLQHQTGILPGKYNIIQTAIQKLEKLKTTQGNYLELFLSKTTCPAAACARSACTITEYENCKEVLFDSKYVLTDNSEHSIILSQKRNDLYASIIAGLNHYFNLDDLRHFELFNQKLYKPKECQPGQNASSEKTVTTQNFVEDLNHLGSFYGMSETDIENMKTNWDQFLDEILSNEKYVQNINEPFEVFWPMTLKNELLKLKHLTPSLSLLINKMLVTPFSSAEAERAFSFVTREKSGARSRLTPENLDKIMRIYLNGSKDFTTFNALRATKNWLLKHSRADDPSVQMPRENEQKSCQFEKSSIFSYE